MTIGRTQLENVKAIESILFRNMDHEAENTYLGFIAVLLTAAKCVHLLTRFSVCNSVVTGSTVLKDGSDVVIKEYNYRNFKEIIDGVLGKGFHQMFYNESMKWSCTKHSDNASYRRVAEIVRKWRVKHENVVQLTIERAKVQEEITAINYMLEAVEKYPDLKKNTTSTNIQRWLALITSKKMRLCAIEAEL